MIAAKASRARRGQEHKRHVHVLKTWPDGMSKGVALCGADPKSGWTEVPEDVDCPRCLARLL